MVFQKSIDGLTVLVELVLKVAVYDPVLLVFRTRNQVKVLYWYRNGFCLWLKRLEVEGFKCKADAADDAIELTVRELKSGFPGRADDRGHGSPGAGFRPPGTHRLIGGWHRQTQGLPSWLHALELPVLSRRQTPGQASHRRRVPP